MDNQWKILVLLLQQIAEQKGLTQQQIAEKAQMHQSHISRFFALKYAPNMDTFFKVSKAINVNVFCEDQENKVDIGLSYKNAVQELLNKNINQLKNL